MPLTRARAAVAGIGASVLLFIGASSGAWAQTAVQTVAQAPAGMTVEVPVQAFAYQPTALTVPAGTTVTWTNLDPVAHTVTDINSAYDSGLFEESGTWSMTFTEPGTYTYYCIPHPMMIGTVEVTN